MNSSPLISPELHKIAAQWTKTTNKTDESPVLNLWFSKLEFNDCFYPCASAPTLNALLHVIWIRSPPKHQIQHFELVFDFQTASDFSL